MINKKLSLQLNLTNICASNCVTCMKKTWPQEHMSDEVFESLLIDYVFNSGKVKSVFLTGGEPLLYPRIKELANFLSVRAIDIGLLTAGNVDVDWEFFVSDESIKWIRFSIDAADEETYRKIRRVDTFEKVLGNLKKLKELSDNYGRDKNFLRVNFTRSNLNIDQEIRLKGVLLNREIDIPIKTWGVIYRDILQRAEDKIGVPLDFKYCIIPERHAIIDTDGSVYPCCNLMYELDDYNNKERDKWCYGKITPNEGLFEIFNSSKAKEIRKHLYDNRHDACRFCYRYYIENAYYEKYLEDGGLFL